MSREICQLEEGQNWFPLEYQQSVGPLSQPPPPHENTVYQKLKYRYDVNFRVIAFGVGVIKMNYFSTSLLKIDTKNYQFRYESKHHGILNEKRLNIS